jgi:hypothetical protein
MPLGLSRTALPRLLVIVVAVLGVGSTVMAQTPTRDRPFPVLLNARHWGPFLVVPSFTIDNFGYDNNAFLVSTATGSVAQGDFVVRLGPEITAQTTFGRRFALTIHDKLAGEVFLSYSELDHADNSADAQFDAFFGPLLLTTYGSYSRMQWRPNMGPNNDFSDIVRQNNSQLRETARLFVGPHTDVALSAGLHRFAYVSKSGYLYDLNTYVPLSVALNRDEDELAAEAGWRPRARTRLFLKASRRHAVFSTDIVAGSNRNTVQTDYVVGGEFSASSRLSGRLEVGSTHLEGEDPALGNYVGRISKVELVYRPTGSTRLTVRFERQPWFSAWYQNLYMIDTVRGAELATYLGAFWGLQGGFSRSEWKYPKPAPAGSYEYTHDGVPVGMQRVDITSDDFVGVLFRMKGGFEIGLRYGIRDRTSTYGPRYEYSSNYISTTGSYAF